MKGLQRSMARGPRADQPVVKRRIPFDKSLSFTGITDTVVHQQAVIGGLPAGNLLLLGAVAYLTLQGPTSANLTNDFEGDYSVGSAPNADTSLSGTDVDIVGSQAIAAATAELSPTVRGVNATQAILDNTDGAMELNLNVLLDANEVTNAQVVAIRARGVLEIAYIVLGDD